jgi:hypothetical protein|tara:strand:- start:223 stop:429 length:207 start_codon:yes stop_codon:yes gene_type:complete
MSFITNETRKKLNYVFFWVNLLAAFLLAYHGSWMCLVNLGVAFFCWCAYRFQDALEEETRIKGLDDKK